MQRLFYRVNEHAAKLVMSQFVYCHIPFPRLAVNPHVSGRSVGKKRGWRASLFRVPFLIALRSEHRYSYLRSQLHSSHQKIKQ